MRRLVRLTQRAMHGADLDEEQRAFIWNTIDSIKQRPERRIADDMRTMFRRQGARTAERIREGSRSTRQLSAESVFDVGEALRELLNDIEPGLYQALETGFQQAGQRIELQTTFDPNDPAITSSTNALNSQLANVPTHTQRLISEVIRNAQAEGLSVDEIAQRVSDRFEQMSRVRSRRIAATTTTTAFEAGQESAYRTAGIAGSQWLSQRDGRVRGRKEDDGHWEADGQKRALGERFRVRGGIGRPYERLNFPGDPAGEPSNVVHCRCTRLPLLELDD